MPLSDADLKAFSDFERSGWENAADPYHRHWGGLSVQSAGSMLDAVRVSPGSRVLDVATGAGYVAAAAHRRGASAIGVDFSNAQIDLARSTYPGVEFEQANAEDLPFADGTFDSVVMGFGMNHMPKPEIVCGEVFRVLKKGGRFAFTVWAAPQEGEGFGIVLSAIDEHGLPITDLPDAPPYFRFADSREVRGVLEQSGFVDIGTELVQQLWHHDHADQLFDAFNEGAVRATAMLRSQPRERLDAIRAHVLAETLKLKQGNRFVVPVPAALSFARKP